VQNCGNPELDYQLGVVKEVSANGSDTVAAHVRNLEVNV
jgi:hypothetical protein